MASVAKPGVRSLMASPRSCRDQGLVRETVALVYLTACKGQGLMPLSGAFLDLLRLHGLLRRAAGDGDPIERHALDAAPEQLSFLRGQGASVDPHPGDL